jgi:hypothetical protein
MFGGDSASTPFLLPRTVATDRLGGGS